MTERRISITDIDIECDYRCLINEIEDIVNVNNGQTLSQNQEKKVKTEIIKGFQSCDSNRLDTIDGLL